MLQKRQRALAGLLRETVTLQRRALDANGDRLGVWTDEFESPARVLVRTQGETVLQSRIAGVQPVEITLRLNPYSAAVDTDWRVLWQGVAYGITATAPDELHSTVTLLAVRSRDGN